MGHLEHWASDMGQSLENYEMTQQEKDEIAKIPYFATGGAVAGVLPGSYLSRLVVKSTYCHLSSCFVNI